MRRQNERWVKREGSYELPGENRCQLGGSTFDGKPNGSPRVNRSAESRSVKRRREYRVEITRDERTVGGVRERERDRNFYLSYNESRRCVFRFLSPRARSAIASHTCISLSKLFRRFINKKSIISIVIRVVSRSYLSSCEK